MVVGEGGRSSGVLLYNNSRLNTSSSHSSKLCIYIKVAELNTPSDGNSAYQYLDISQIRQFKNGL